jgi:hypothetical protein
VVPWGGVDCGGHCPRLSKSGTVRDTTGVISIATGPPTEQMGGEGRLWEDSGTPSQNHGKTMAEPGTEGSLNQNPRKPMIEQTREECTSKHPYPGCRVENRTIWDHTTQAHPHSAFGRETSSVPDASRLRLRVLQRQVLCSLHAHLQSYPWPCSPADDLLETTATCAVMRQSTPLQVYFFSYILPYSCTGKPKFSYWGSCPRRVENQQSCSPIGHFVRRTDWI